jgi:predicted NUDIX family NTP pyrophosphohydrolase
MTKKRFSAGILLYKCQGTEISFFLVHPGGPFFAKKDEGWWTVPKGEVEDNESELEAAKREFQEETGYLPRGSFIRLDPVKQKSGKIVLCWAVEGDIDPERLISNNFQMEWPPKSGRIQTYPEIDSGAWFTMEEAKRKINVQQISFLAQIAAIFDASTVNKS